MGRLWVLMFLGTLSYNGWTQSLFLGSASSQVQGEYVEKRLLEAAFEQGFLVHSDVYEQPLTLEVALYLARDMRVRQVVIWSVSPSGMFKAEVFSLHGEKKAMVEQQLTIDLKRPLTGIPLLEYMQIIEELM
jgi:hypothetical protein